MKTLIYHRMFGYSADLLANQLLVEFARWITTIEQARKCTDATIGFLGWVADLSYIVVASCGRFRQTNDRTRIIRKAKNNMLIAKTKELF
ncbi:hypothetical protein JYT95_01110 [bacterium AH-315-J23]|nr:hypothetical protein [bacterium AH-315-J23]